MKTASATGLVRSTVRLKPTGHWHLMTSRAPALTLPLLSLYLPQAHIRRADNHRRSPAPLPQRPKGPLWEITKFTVGKSWSGHLWYTNFLVPDTPPSSSLLMSA